MPFVVVTTAEAKKNSSDAERQASHVLNIADRIVEFLGDRFRSESWKIFEGFSEESLAGEPVSAGQGSVRPSSFWIPLPGASTLSGIPREDERTEVHQHHCIVIDGFLHLGQLDAVPARFEVNLDRQWAKEQGDIVFETYKTARVKADGLSGLVALAGTSGYEFAKKLGTYLGTINHDLKSGPKIRWASLKEFEGAEEPETDYTFLYRADSMRISRLIQGELTRIATAAGRDIYASCPIKSEALYRKTVEGLVSELSAYPLFSDAASSVSKSVGLYQIPTGSVLFFSRDQKSTTQVAERIFNVVSDSFKAELKHRIGSAGAWPGKLSTLIGETKQLTLGLDWRA